MKVLKSLSSLSRLYTELLRRPSGQNEVDVLGTLHSTLRGLWRYEAVVDRWPDFSAVVLRPLQLIPRQSKYQEVYACGNCDSMKDLLISKDSLPWNECMTFRSCPVELKPALEEAARCHQGRLVATDCHYERSRLSQDLAKNLDNEPLPKGYVTSPLELKDARFVQNHWNEFAEEHNHCISSLETFEHLILHSLTSSVYSPSGTPVSWIILHHSGAELAGYTLPEYRGSNLLKRVGHHLHQGCLEYGQPHVHGIVAVGNTKISSFINTFLKPIPGHVTFYHYKP